MRIEEAVKKRVVIGSKISYNNLVNELGARFNNMRAIDHAIHNLVKIDDF